MSRILKLISRAGPALPAEVDRAYEAEQPAPPPQAYSPLAGISVPFLRQQTEGILRSLKRKDDELTAEIDRLVESRRQHRVVMGAQQAQLNALSGDLSNFSEAR